MLNLVNALNVDMSQVYTQSVGEYLYYMVLNAQEEVFTDESRDLEFSIWRPSNFTKALRVRNLISRKDIILMISTEEYTLDLIANNREFLYDNHMKVDIWTLVDYCGAGYSRVSSLYSSGLYEYMLKYGEVADGIGIMHYWTKYISVISNSLYCYDENGVYLDEVEEVVTILKDILIEGLDVEDEYVVQKLRNLFADQYVVLENKRLLSVENTPEMLRLEQFYRTLK